MGTCYCTVSLVRRSGRLPYSLVKEGGDLADLNGTVGLDLAGGQDITDLAGNALPTAEPGSEQTYTMDNAPILLSPRANAILHVRTRKAPPYVHRRSNGRPPDA